MGPFLSQPMIFVPPKGTLSGELCGLRYDKVDDENRIKSMTISPCNEDASKR